MSNERCEYIHNKPVAADHAALCQCVKQGFSARKSKHYLIWAWQTRSKLLLSTLKLSVGSQSKIVETLMSKFNALVLNRDDDENLSHAVEQLDES